MSGIVNLWWNAGDMHIRKCSINIIIYILLFVSMLLFILVFSYAFLLFTFDLFPSFVLALLTV